MAIRSTREVPAELERTRRSFERWRQTRRERSPIPRRLWASAVKAAGKYGLSRTAQALRLDYYALKKRVAADACRNASDSKAVATFVELASPASDSMRAAVSGGRSLPASGDRPECILELEDPGGAKMRIHVKGVEMPDLVALSRTFWSVEA
jgi:hypothetical protein